MSDANDQIPEKLIPESPNFQTELASKIAEIAPEVISDGKLDIIKLRELIGGDVESSAERFGLFWPGKQRAQAVAQLPTTATLKPSPEESVDWDTTKNLFIEGDNLEVLKALQNSYRRKVKMIYIDPPYNTGKEFIYPDNFQEGLQSYLEYTGQKNEAGETTESKKETGGRKHSNWLSMMYPRLQLAKSLLRDDGVIFISIDDNEYANLKVLCDEVLGADNLIANTVRVSNSAKNNSNYISVTHDYGLIYARNKEMLNKGWQVPKKNAAEFEKIAKRLAASGTGKEQIEKELKALVKNPRFYDFDHYYYWDERGVFRTDNSGGVDNGNFQTDIIHPVTKQPCAKPAKGWRYSDEKIREMLRDDMFYFGKDEKTIPLPKRYLHDYLNSIPSSISFFDTQIDANFLKKEKIPFDFPKPVDYIKYLIQMSATNESSIVMDFFSGSATTAHAVMQLNAEDGGNRTHIQVQLPELTDKKSGAYKAGYKTIAEVSRERIRRAAARVKEDSKDRLAERSTPLDTGFRVYKLVQSNFIQWDESAAAQDPQQAVLDFAANKKPDAAPEELLTEIMLYARIPLSADIQKHDLPSGGWVYVVDGGNLIAYVDNAQITEAQASEIADMAPGKLIILDNAFNGNDALKINIANICKEKFIKEFKTI